MQIIFDQKLVPELKNRYVMLELDTVMQDGLSEPIVLWALIENISSDMLDNLELYKLQHEKLIVEYKNSQWNECKASSQALKSLWNNELDEFYDLVISTADQMIKNNQQWDGVRYITPKDNE